MFNVMRSKQFIYDRKRFIQVFLNECDKTDVESSHARYDVVALIGTTREGIDCSQIPLNISWHKEKIEAIKDFNKLVDYYSVNGDPEHKRAGNIIKGLRKAGYDARASRNSDGRIHKIVVRCGTTWGKEQYVEEYYMTCYSGQSEAMVKAILEDLNYWERKPTLKAKRKETRK